MLIFSNNTKQRKGVLPKGLFRNWGYLLTIYTGIPGKEDILVGKSNGSCLSVWEASVDMGGVCGNAIIFLLCFSLFS